MKQQGGTNTPKTLTELRKGKHRLKSELDRLKGLARETRLKGSHVTLAKNRSIKELEDRLHDVNSLLEQKQSTAKGKMTERTPPKMANDPNKTFTSVFVGDDEKQPTSRANDFFTSTADTKYHS